MLVAILVSVFIIGKDYYKKGGIVQQEDEIALKSQQEKERLLLQDQLGQQALDAKSQSATLEELKKQIADLKNRPQVIPKSNDADYSGVIAGWQGRIARVQCNWAYGDDKVYKTNQASGVLVNLTGIGTSLVTNKHAVFDGSYVASWCVIGVYNKGARIVEYVTNKSPFILGDDQDFAYIKLGSEYNLPTNPQNSDYGYFDEVVLQHLEVCTGKVNIGDKVIVLGYPAIGTQGGITATEGIISGLEGDYYVTSAKIDHGNSGGAAILLKDNCYLGIPTWVLNLGGFESLGRILKSILVIGE